jgi:hypothetical protein
VYQCPTASLDAFLCCPSHSPGQDGKDPARVPDRGDFACRSAGSRCRLPAAPAGSGRSGRTKGGACPCVPAAAPTGWISPSPEPGRRLDQMSETQRSVQVKRHAAVAVGSSPPACRARGVAGGRWGRGPSDVLRHAEERGRSRHVVRQTATSGETHINPESVEPGHRACVRQCCGPQIPGVQGRGHRDQPETKEPASRIEVGMSRRTAVHVTRRTEEIRTVVGPVTFRGDDTQRGGHPGQSRGRGTL